MARTREELLDSFFMNYNNGILSMKFARNKNVYTRNVHFCISPTANCQMMSAQYGCHLVEDLDKYQTREALIRLKGSYYSKRILMVDVKRKYSEKFTSALSPLSIISLTDYKSTNGSLMTIILIRLASIRQFRNIPD